MLHGHTQETHIAHDPCGDGASTAPAAARPCEGDVSEHDREDGPDESWGPAPISGR